MDPPEEDDEPDPDVEEPEAEVGDELFVDEVQDESVSAVVMTARVSRVGRVRICIGR